MNRTAKIANMFSRITKVYDVLNDIMSFGLSRIWRIYASQAALKGKKGDCSVLDLAIGTGYMTRRILKDSGGNIKIIGCDITRDMLLSAYKSLGNSVSLVLGDGNFLPFRDGSFNSVVSAFSLRSFIEEGYEGLLHEIKRTLKEDGSVVFVDTGMPQGSFMKAFFYVYMKIIKNLGGLYDKKSYEWLANSIWTLNPVDFRRAMISAGYDAEVYSLPFGVPYLFIGRKER